MQLDRNGEPLLFALPKRHPQHTRKVRVQVGASTEHLFLPLGDFVPVYGGKEFWIRFSTEQIQNPWIRGTGVFSYGANRKPFDKGNDNLFLCLKEKGRKRSKRACSSTAMASRALLLCRKDIRNTRGKYRFDGVPQRDFGNPSGGFFPGLVWQSGLEFGFLRNKFKTLW